MDRLQLIKTRLMKTGICLLLAVLMLLTSAIFIHAAGEIEWNLLTDKQAGYRVENRHGSWVEDEEDDGTPYMYNTDNQSGALYIWDDNNILSTYKTFSLSGDFYFESFPSGLRDGTHTPDQSPLSFLCWVYDRGPQSTYSFNALRIDSQGYIHTSQSGKDRTDIKLDLNRWMNIKCVFTPESGMSELWIDGRKVLDFNISKFDPEKYTSAAVRYFDGYYEWSVKMKNLKVSSDNNYEIQMKRETAADYVGYQTAVPENGKFDTRLIFGVDSLDVDNVGYEVIVVKPNGDAKQLSEISTTVYSTIKDASGKSYIPKGEFGYQYVAAMTVEDLPNEDFELVVRPYVKYGTLRRYGIATRLYYQGGKDASGYPQFSTTLGEMANVSVPVSHDTYVFNMSSTKEADNGSQAKMQVVNKGDFNSGLFRAAYFRFDLDKEAVAALQSAVKAELRVFVTGSEVNAERKKYDMVVYGTQANWTEHELNYVNALQKADRLATIGQTPYEDGAYIIMDVLDYLNERPLNDDGTLTVSFSLTQENGYSDVLMAYLCSKEGASPASIEISASVSGGSTLELNLSKMHNEGYEPWGYAEAIVDKWFNESEPEIYVRNPDGSLKEFDIEDLDPEGYNATTSTGDFAHEVTWRGTSTANVLGVENNANTWTANKYVRTLATLGSASGNSFLDSDFAQIVTEYDSYGGIVNAGFTGKATGFFHTEEIGGRHYIIDPLGNPYFAVGINAFKLGETDNLSNYALAKFGTEDQYYKSVSNELMSLGVNTAFGNFDTVLKVEDGLSGVVGFSIVSQYMSSLGLRGGAESTPYTHNNTINVFDPDFVAYSDKLIYEEITKNGYADDPRVFGYTTDNELPSGNDMLMRYLMLDPKEPANGFSYAVAWTWLARRLDMPNPSLDDLLKHPDAKQLNSEFLGFVYSRIYDICGSSIEKVDQNHMYLGSRVNDICRTDPYYLHAAGYYLDILTCNLYGGMNPSAETITDFYRQSGKPFIVTEFFAKGMDAIDGNGYTLANSTGSGILVRTQEDRATYYEHYVMALLESKACVGWAWYRYRDNDQSLYRSTSNNSILRMLSVDYSTGTAKSYWDENDNVITAAEAGTVNQIYKGEAIASNQNVNKGFYNADFSSAVTVYTYENDLLISSSTYRVEKPSSADLKDGDVVKGTDGTAYTIGTTAKGSTTTVTILTVYEGRYLALTNKVAEINSYLIGLVKYFDADMND